MSLTLDHLCRFWSRVEKSDACWLWTGTKVGVGYGVFPVNGKYRMAHRLSFELHHGKIAEGLECCHRCDVPACVNPNHLFIGTHTDNMRDCEIKGRNPHRKGEKHHKAKLTDETVRLIASELKNRTATQWEIAKKFGVTQSTVSLIKLGKIWTHIA